MKRRLGSKLFLIVLVLIFTVASFSQTEETGAITGKVVDPAEFAIPGVKVRISSTGTNTDIVTATDIDGNFRAGNLPPSNDFQVKVEMPGYHTAIRSGLIVEKSKSTNILLTMIVKGDEMIIWDPPPIIEYKHSGITTSLGQRNLSALPRLNDYRDSLFFMPNVVESGIPDNPSFAGSTSGENMYLVDGLNVGNPSNGHIENILSVHFISDMILFNHSSESEYSSSTGGLFEIRTKTGYNEFHGELFGYYSNGSWAAKSKATDFPTTKSVNPGKSYDYGLDFEGPIVEDKLNFFVGYNPGYRSEHVSNKGFRRESDYDNTERSWNGVAKITWRLTDLHTIETTQLSDSSRIHNNEGNEFALSDLARMTTRIRSSTRVSVNWYATWSPYVFSQSGWGKSHSRNDVTPQYEWQFGINSVVNRDLNLELNPTSGFYSFSDIDTSQFSHETMILAKRKHEIKIGFLKENRLVSTNSGPTGTGWIDLFNSLTNDSATQDRLAYSFWSFTYAEHDPHLLKKSGYFALYAQDIWTIGDSLVVNYGIRGERNSFKPRGGESFNLDSWSPRVGLAWDAARNGLSKVFAYWGKFVEQPPMGFLDRMITSRKYYWQYYQGNDPWYGYFLAPPRATVLPGTGNQYKEEIVAGFELEILPDLAIGAYGQYSDLKQALEDVGNANYHYFIGNPDGTLPPVKHIWGKEHYYPWPKPIRRYKSFTLTARKRFFGNWFLNASYTLSNLKGNYNGESGGGYADTRNKLADTSYYGDIPDGTLIKNTYGFLPTDRRHVVKAQGAYQFDFGLTIGAVFLFQTGRPFNRLDYYNVGFPSYTTGYETAPIFIEPRGSAGRLPSEWSLDLRLQYTFKIRKFDYSFMVDVFNVTNNQVPTELYEYQKYGNRSIIGGKQVWGSVMRRQPPRFIQIGFKISF